MTLRDDKDRDGTVCDGWTVCDGQPDAPLEQGGAETVCDGRTTLREMMRHGVEKLATASVADAGVDARLLASHVTGWDRTQMILRRRDTVPVEVAAAYEGLLERRCQGEPTQYIIGEQDFMGLTFHVEPGVLIPRPETELLVEEALSILEGWKASGRNDLTVLDIGCGSGAIGVSIAALFPDAKVTCVDISEDALAIAKGNAERIVGEERIVDELGPSCGERKVGELGNAGNIVEFLQGDLFAPVEGRRFDMILSNPPYIPDEVIRGLAQEVRDHEPNLALSGGEDGLDCYRKLAPGLPAHLKEGGCTMMEIGHDQMEAVSQLMRETGAFGRVEGRRDLAGLDRIVCGFEAR